MFINTIITPYNNTLVLGKVDNEDGPNDKNKPHYEKSKASDSLKAKETTETEENKSNKESSTKKIKKSLSPKDVTNEGTQLLTYNNHTEHGNNIYIFFRFGGN